MKKNSYRASVAIAAICIAVFSTGCTEKKQTYAEAVHLYEAEMAELTRLENRREEIVQAAEVDSKIGDLKTARDLLGSNAGDLQKVLREATGGLINEADASKADKAIDKNLKVLDDQIAKQAENKSKAQETADKELPELDRQIAKQKERVEAARKAKEALAPN